jgi:hypothetical protein
MDALKLELLPFRARQHMVEQIRHEHMIDLLKRGVVPLLVLGGDGDYPEVATSRRQVTVVIPVGRCQDCAGRRSLTIGREGTSIHV